MNEIADRLTAMRAAQLALIECVPPIVNGGEELSPRQREIAALLVRGKMNQEIAETMGIAAATVKTQLALIADKVRAHNRTHIAALVAREQTVCEIAKVVIFADSVNAMIGQMADSQNVLAAVAS